MPHRKPVGEYPYEFATAADYDKVMKFVIERVPAELDFHLSYTHSALSSTLVVVVMMMMNSDRRTTQITNYIRKLGENEG